MSTRGNHHICKFRMNTEFDLLFSETNPKQEFFWKGHAKCESSENLLLILLLVWMVLDTLLDVGVNKQELGDQSSTILVYAAYATVSAFAYRHPAELKSKETELRLIEDSIKEVSAKLQQKEEKLDSARRHVKHCARKI